MADVDRKRVRKLKLIMNQLKALSCAQSHKDSSVAANSLNSWDWLTSPLNVCTSWDVSVHTQNMVYFLHCRPSAARCGNRPSAYGSSLLLPPSSLLVVLLSMTNGASLKICTKAPEASSPPSTLVCPLWEWWCCSGTGSENLTAHFVEILMCW